jgi:hypothetical protein
MQCHRLTAHLLFVPEGHSANRRGSGSDSLLSNEILLVGNFLTNECNYKATVDAAKGLVLTDGSAPGSALPMVYWYDVMLRLR